MLKLNKELLKKYLQIKAKQQKLKAQEDLIKEAIIDVGKEKFKLGEYKVTVIPFESAVEAHIRKGKRIAVKKDLHSL